MKFLKKRIYEKSAKADGCRVLVDRLWPRGVTKSAAQIDLWPKQIAPSTELRKWFHAGDDRYAEFVARYQAELDAQRDGIKDILGSIDQKTVTLLSAVKDLEQSHVAVLAKYLAKLT